MSAGSKPAAATRALGTSERPLRAILENTPSVVAVKDLEGRYLMTNAETGSCSACAPEDLIGRACGELSRPAWRRQIRANELRAATEGEPVYDEAMVLSGRRAADVRDRDLRAAGRAAAARPRLLDRDGRDRAARAESERRERRQWGETDRGGARPRAGWSSFAQPIVGRAPGRRGAASCWFACSPTRAAA